MTIIFESEWFKYLLINIYIDKKKKITTSQLNDLISKSSHLFSLIPLNYHILPILLIYTLIDPITLFFISLHNPIHSRLSCRTLIIGSAYRRSLIEM